MFFHIFLRVLGGSKCFVRAFSMAEVPFLREQRRDLEEKRQAAVEEQMRSFERGMAAGREQIL